MAVRKTSKNQVVSRQAITGPERLCFKVDRATRSVWSFTALGKLAAPGGDESESGKCDDNGVVQRIHCDFPMLRFRSPNCLNSVEPSPVSLGEIFQKRARTQSPRQVALKGE